VGCKQASGKPKMGPIIGLDGRRAGPLFSSRILAFINQANLLLKSAGRAQAASGRQVRRNPRGRPKPTGSTPPEGGGGGELICALLSGP